MARHNFPTSVRNGDRSQGHDRPGPVVSYQLTPGEITARYGAPKKGGDEDMAIKITPQEALQMRDTADRLAPVTQPARPMINRDIEVAAEAEAELEPVKPRQLTPTKHCGKCGKDKPLDQFYQGRSRCKACEREDSTRRQRERRAAKAAKVAETVTPAIADAIPVPTIPAAAPAPASQAVKDYAAEHGINLEVTGSGHMIGPSVVAVLGLLDEARRYRVVMSVEEA